MRSDASTNLHHPAPPQTARQSSQRDANGCTLVYQDERANLTTSATPHIAGNRGSVPAAPRRRRSQSISYWLVELVRLVKRYTEHHYTPACTSLHHIAATNLTPEVDEVGSGVGFSGRRVPTSRINDAAIGTRVSVTGRWLAARGLPIRSFWARTRLSWSPRPFLSDARPPVTSAVTSTRTPPSAFGCHNQTRPITREGVSHKTPERQPYLPSTRMSFSNLSRVPGFGHPGVIA